MNKRDMLKDFWLKSQDGSQQRPILLFVSAIVTIGLFKLLLISKDEIVAIPYDSLSYAFLASRFYFLSDTDRWIPPLFPLIASIFYALGIPYRIGIELIYLSACSFMGLAFLRLSHSLTLGIFCLALSALHPYTFNNFRYFMTEPLYCSFLLLFFGIALLLFKRANREHYPLLILLGFTGGCLSLIRLETPVILAFLVLFALARVIAIPTIDQSRITILRCLLAILIPLVSFQSVITLASTANFLRWGVFAISSQSDGLKKLLTTLYSIKVEDSVQYAPVTRKSLQIAFELSPSFKRLEGRLMDPENFFYQIGEALIQRKGEFASSLNWAIVFASSEETRSVREANELLLRANAEIVRGLKERNIATHSVITYPIDPNYSNWLPSVFREVWSKVLLWSIDAPVYAERPQDMVGLTPEEIRLFDRAANRRRSIVASEDGFGERGREGKRAGVLLLISRNYYYLLVGSLVVYLVAIVLTRKPRSASKQIKEVAFGLSFVLVCLFIRILLYAVIDASAYRGQARYVALQAPSFAWTIVFASYLIKGLLAAHVDYSRKSAVGPRGAPQDP